MYMKMFKMALLSLLLVGTTLSAGEGADKSKSKKKMTPAQEKAAYELFDAIKLGDGIRMTQKRTLELMIKRQPAMTPYKNIYLEYFDKYTKWDDMKKDVAKMYSSVFTADELKKLTKFYSSKLGKKSLMYMPRLSQATMIYAQKRIALHAKEIKDAIAKEARKLEKESEASQ
jgi:hypothetical protein